MMLDKSTKDLEKEAKELGIHLFSMKTDRCKNCGMHIDKIKQKDRKTKVYIKYYKKTIPVWIGCEK